MAQKQSSKSKSSKLSLEALLTSEAGFGLTQATNLQRAACRAIDGAPLAHLWEDPVVRSAFGGVQPPAQQPAILMLLAAIRGGKSMIAAASAICASQNADLTGCSVGDLVRIPVLSTDKTTARATFSHIVGNLQAKPALRKILIGEPTSESIILRHPSGRPIEIAVVALNRAGSTLVGCWLAACIFDEAPRMVGEQDGVKNLDDSLNAIAGRMKGPIILIGSPWAPMGPCYNLVTEHFGKPSGAICVIRAPGPAMNPAYWTPERCADLQRRNPNAYRTDVLGEFADPEEALFSSIEIEQQTRASPLILPPKQNSFYCAAMDPATRGNAWTLIILEGSGLGGPGGICKTYEIAVSKQWIGSKSDPLSPDRVLGEIAEVCRQYRIDAITTDQYSVDAVRDLADRHGLTVWESPFTSENRLKRVETVRTLLSEGCLRLAPDPMLKADLIGARRRVTQNGVTLVLPKTGDGRHADFVPALALAVANPPDMPYTSETKKDPELLAMTEQIDRRNSLDALEAAALRICR